MVECSRFQQTWYFTLDKEKNRFKVFVNCWNKTVMQYLSLRLEGEEILKYRCVCPSRAERFNIVRNNHGRTHKCDFSVSNRKYLFWENLVQNIKIVSLSWNLVPRLIRICGPQWWYLFFILERKHPFWANLVQRIKTASLSWNLVSSLIRICRIQRRCSLFLF